MTAGILVTPGYSRGPCFPECQHKECLEIRKISKLLCSECGKPIGYERRYQDFHDGRIAHQLCIERSLRRLQHG